MLTLEHVKELVNDPSLSEEEIEQIRDGFYNLSEIIYEQWKLEFTLESKNPFKGTLNKDKS
ncbi:MAG: hypothetical protein NTX65_05165 [Ignavibacteriales bacterium]|nr:hypothetical protein [Ignavibacteriales bacterium]